MLKCDKEVEALVEKYLNGNKKETIEAVLLTGMSRRKTLKNFAKSHPYVPVAERKPKKAAAKKPAPKKAPEPKPAPKAAA